MHQKILSDNQKEILPVVHAFKKDFYLVGGTAIALQLGHRSSIDFDLFSFNHLKRKKILDIVSSFGFPIQITRNVEEQINMTVHGVKMTFFEYPFRIDHPLCFDNGVTMPDLLSLAAMKAYALGRRSKWKDYVDLFYILQHNYSIKDIESKATEIFGQLFSPKLFRSQLSWFDDIDYSEKIDYSGDPVEEEFIRKTLSDIAVQVD